MAGGTSGDPCAAHNCLKPRWKDGWCAAHFYAHRVLSHLQNETEDDSDSSLAIREAIWVLLRLQSETEDESGSLAICEAIWDAS